MNYEDNKGTNAGRAQSSPQITVCAFVELSSHNFPMRIALCELCTECVCEFTGISALIGNRSQETLRKHGCDEQNGFLNKKGCIDGSFCLRNSLHARKSFGHET